MSKHIVYRLEVLVARPLADSDDDADYDTLEAATTIGRRREVEETLLACLRKMDGDCDVEVLDWRVGDDDDPHGPYCPCSSCQHERAADTALEVNRD